MHIDRTLLYMGVFLAAIGAALLAADSLPVTTDGLIDVLRLWPLGLTAVGAGMALRRTPLNLPSGLLAAAVPGLVLGVAIAAAPRLAIERGYWDEIKAASEWRQHCADLGAHFGLGDDGIDPIGGCS